MCCWASSIVILNLRTYTPYRKDNPQEISDHLIAQHGTPEAALAAAAVGSVEAQKKKDLYGLSVWCDVKRILSEQVEVD